MFWLSIIFYIFYCPFIMYMPQIRRGEVENRCDYLALRTNGYKNIYITIYLTMIGTHSALQDPLLLHALYHWIQLFIGLPLTWASQWQVSRPICCIIMGVLRMSVGLTTDKRSTSEQRGLGQLPFYTIFKPL